MTLKERKIRLRIGSFLDAKGYRYVNGYAIDAIWAAWRNDGKWTLTHRGSGYAAGHVETFAKARKLAEAFLREVPAKKWKFKNGAHVANNPAFKNCRAILLEH